MIIFDEITYKNFLSTGNNGNTIFLNRTPSALITGHNGSGKSTLLDAICFGIFNKPYRNISKPQLINSVNEKGCEVEIKFRVNNVPYRVMRSMKPYKFEVYRNEQLIPHDAAVKDYQKKLEDILGLNYKAFTQIVILGSARYQSFMDLGTHDRRGIIEEILDITVFTRMNEVLKTRVQNLGLDVKENDYQKDIIKTKINAQKTLIDSISARSRESTEKLEQEENKTIGQIDLLDFKINKYDSDIRVNTEMIVDDKKLRDELKAVEMQLHRLKTKRTGHSDRVAYYESHDVCGECEQDITVDIKTAKVSENNTEIEKISNTLELGIAAMDKLREKVSVIDACKEKLTESNTQKVSLQSEQKQLKAYLKKVQQNKDLKADKDALKEAQLELGKLNEEAKTLEQNSHQYAELQHYLDACKILLKDSGIKAKIIKQYLPVMNQLINQYLDRMGANYSFTLDEQFNEVIKSRYRDNFSYASFSEGEKMRIDLALMFTWREIAKLKNSVNTNLLIMDEVGDSSLDAEATDILWDILGTLDDANVFVISHKAHNGDRFRTLIEFYKDGNFSKIRDSKK